MRNFRQSIDWSSYLTTNDLVCFSPVSWEKAHKRQQHLMKTFAKTYRVFFIEEPVLHAEEDNYTIRLSESGVLIVTPYLQEKNYSDMDLVMRKKKLISKIFI